MKKQIPPKPTGPVTEEQLKDSGIEWVLCGGVNVGMHNHPYVWKLRPIDEEARERQRADDLSKLARAVRILDYYANEAHYVDGDYGYNLISPIELDKGERARKFLESIRR